MLPKLLSAATLLSVISLDCASAEGSCGPGVHRNSYGYAVPMEVRSSSRRQAPVVVAPAAPIVVAPTPVVCRGGFRWHPGLRRCVVI
jgi:hypothetical protein